MRSPRRLIYEKIKSLGNTADRFHDIAARVRVYRRTPDDKLFAAELLDRTWGGRYDTWARKYVGEPARIVELKAHPGQVELLTFDKPGVRRVLMIGAAGGGKTEGLVLRALLAGIEKPHRIGGVVAPTEDRAKTVLDKFLKLVGPLGWVREHRKGDLEVLLHNGTLFQFSGVRGSSRLVGSPHQGLDWDFAIEDESQNITDAEQLETDFRDRRQGDKYRVWSSATNQSLAHFQSRLDDYRARPDIRHIITSSGFDNSFVPRSNWTAFESEMSPEVFKQFVLGEDPPRSGMVYPRFDVTRTLRQLPELGRDITGRLTRNIYGAWTDEQGIEHEYDFVVGHDWGLRVMASVVLKAYATQDPGERMWFAVGEVTSEDGAHPDRHAEKLKQYMREKFSAGPRGFIVIGDPHYNHHVSDGPDRTDYQVFRAAGIETHRASGKVIPLHHRISMVNALLEDVTGRRRLHVVKDERGQSPCKQLVQSFKHYRWGKTGRPEQHNKGPGDMSHWTDALGYGLFPFERIRGIGALPGRQAPQTRNMPPSAERGWWSEEN